MIGIFIPFAIIGVMAILIGLIEIMMKLIIGFIEIMINLIKHIIQLLWLLHHLLI